MSEREGELFAQLVRIREGADATPVEPCVQFTAGQFWHMLLEAEPEKRMHKLTTLLDIVHDHFACFAQDHVGRLDELETRLTRFLANEATRL